MVFYWGKQVQLMIIHWNWRVFDLFRQIRVDWAYEMNHPWNLSFCYSYSYPPVKHETSPMDCIRIKISIWLLKGKPKNSNDDRMFSTMFLLFFSMILFRLSGVERSEYLRWSAESSSGPIGPSGRRVVMVGFCTLFGHILEIMHLCPMNPEIHSTSLILEHHVFSSVFKMYQ